MGRREPTACAITFVNTEPALAGSGHRSQAGTQPQPVLAAGVSRAKPHTQPSAYCSPRPSSLTTASRAIATTVLTLMHISMQATGHLEGKMRKANQGLKQEA